MAAKSIIYLEIKIWNSFSIASKSAWLGKRDSRSIVTFLGVVSENPQKFMQSAMHENNAQILSDDVASEN